MQRRKVCLVGVPMDLGQNRRGVDMGPSAIRYAGLGERLTTLGYEIRDLGNVPVPVPEATSGSGGLRHLPAISATCGKIYETAGDCYDEETIMIYLGGDHSISIGTVASSCHAGPVGLLWVDAHGDFNTPASSPSGNVHGMPLAVLLGDGAQELVDVGYPGPKLSPAEIVLLGVRDLDPGEQKALVEKSINVFTMRDIDELGMASIARQALARLSHFDRIHISFDMDCLEPSVAPGVGTPVPGGLSYREAHLLMEILAESGKVSAVDIVEVNPILDDGNRTADMAVKLLESLLGKRIL